MKSTRSSVALDVGDSIEPPKKIYIFRNEACQMLNDLAAINASRTCIQTDDESYEVATEMQERVEGHFRKRGIFLFSALKDFRPIRRFDYDAFIS